MNRAGIAITSLGVGAAAMYLADPERGRRRRARIRDVGVHGSHVLKDAAISTSRDVENRLIGAAARGRTLLAGKPVPDDEVLTARVRARIGRLVSHPGAIDATAASGRVVLSGPVFEAEVEQLIDGVQCVDGVTDVENRMVPYATAADVPALQGAGPLELRALPPGWLRWTPTTRLLAGAMAIVLTLVAARRVTEPEVSS